MPLRSWVQHSVPGMLALTRRGVEHPGVGVPGVCNFVDGETSRGREGLAAAAGLVAGSQQPAGACHGAGRLPHAARRMS